MKIKIHALIALIFCTLFQPLAQASPFSTAGFYAVEGSPRTVANFNPGWRFVKGDVKGAEAVDFDDRDWEAANLPHGLEILGENASGGRNYQGIAWYRKQFTVNNGSGKTFLYFEAVMGEAQVWVNGKKVVEHVGGYLPFAADITDVLNADGKPNLVAVMANNADSSLYPPGQKQSKLDFTYMGGIYRDTFLIQTAPVHVTLAALSKTVAGGGIFAATLDVDDDNAKMEVRTEVVNSSSQSVGLTVKTVLENADGKELKSLKETVKLAAGETRQLSKQFEARNVHLWHPDDPYLHFIRTDVLVGDEVVDSLRTRVGIRLFEMRGPEGFFVNKNWIGKKVIGVNRHQDYMFIGNALPNSSHWRDVKLLREGGCNAIRAAHYPQDPAFYDACDEFGVLTSTANPGWHFFNFKDKIFEERLYDDTRQLVRRDRNVASMLMWETCINEYPSQPDEALSTMHKIAHEENPFPGMFTIADPHDAERGGLDLYYRGSSKTICSFNREYGDGPEVDNWYSQNARTRVKMSWGENAMVRASLIQAANLDARHKEAPVKFGGALWAGIDHQRGYHPDPFRGGLLNGVRLPRYTYYLYKSQEEPETKIPGIDSNPMLFVANELTQISSEDIVVFSNCDEVRLTWFGKEIGRKKPSTDPRYEHLPHPPFIFKDVFDFMSVKRNSQGKKGLDVKLLAEGLIDGKVAVRVEKPYAQRTTGLKMSLADEGMNLRADGSDLVPVRAAVVDQNGTTKVLAEEDIFFVVQGPAELIGTNPARTSMGVATILVRATAEPGSITITAHCNGLNSDVMAMESMPVKQTMLYDAAYAAASKMPAGQSQVVLIQSAGGSDLQTNVKDLQKEVARLELELVGKDQDIMDLRGQLGDGK
jgi:beta-galactosidase